MSEHLSRSDYYRSPTFAPLMAGVLLSVYTDLMQASTEAAQKTDRPSTGNFVLKMIRSSPEQKHSALFVRAEDFSHYVAQQSLFRTIRISMPGVSQPFVSVQLRPTNEAQLHPAGRGAVERGHFASIGAQQFLLQQREDDYYLDNVSLAALTSGDGSQKKADVLNRFQELDELTSVVQSATCIF